MTEKSVRVTDVTGLLICFSRVRVRTRYGEFPANPSHPSLPGRNGAMTMTTTILALDLGTTTGWALHGNDGR